MIEQKITDGERIAVNLLAKYMDQTPENVYNWCRQVTTDPSFAEYGESLDWHTNTSNYAGADFDRFSDLKSERIYYRFLNDACLELGWSIIQFRNDNRTEGDKFTQIDAMSGITVQSSLAADVLRFHESVMNAYAVLREDFA